jgi:hypothetical protein
MQPVYQDNPIAGISLSRRQGVLSLPPFSFSGEAMTVEANQRERALGIDT